MTTVNYPTPVNVNGYSCKNCTDVDNAKRNIDPTHPKDGPLGVNASRSPATPRRSPSAVSFSHLSASDKAPTTPTATQGHRVDLRA